MKKLIFVLFCLSPFFIEAQRKCKSAYTFNQVNPQGEILHGGFNFCNKEGSSGNGYTLIQNSTAPAASAIWCNNSTLDLNLPFSVEFSLRFSVGGNTSGADGLTFTFHKSQDGINALGGKGGRLGYEGVSLNPSTSIEFDIFENGNGHGDTISPNTGENHSTINFDGSFSDNSTGVPVANLGDIEDGKWHTVNVYWDPCETKLCVDFDGENIYCHTKDLINDIFSGIGSNVIWGFTAAKYSQASNHDICFCNLLIGEPCQDETVNCCDGDNLILNGNFEEGWSFSSDYSPVPEGTIINPSNYSVVDYNTANSICENWNVEDHTHCINENNGKILIVNGQTQQATNLNNVIWQTANPIQVEQEEQYKFCAYFQNLLQCCMDTNPRVKIQFKRDGQNWNNLINWTSIDINTTLSGNPCNWQEVGASIFASNSNSLEFRILLDETGNGDGNDIAIDDISLIKLPSSNLEFAFTDSRPNSPNLTASINNINANDDILPSKECKYIWSIGEVVNAEIENGELQITSVANVVNGGSWGTQPWGLSTNFSGYNSSSPGEFEEGKMYFIYLVIYNCECHSFETRLKTTGMPNSLALRKKFGKKLNTIQKVVFDSKLKKRFQIEEIIKQKSYQIIKE